MNGANPELSPLWLSLRSASLAVLLVAPLGFACAILLVFNVVLN